MLENNQQLIVTGSILHLARIDPDTQVVGPARDVGTINVLNPASAATSIQLFDSRGGRRMKISERVVEYSENYEITCSNMSLDNLAFVFGANTVNTYSQSALSAVAVNHTMYPDSVLHLHDSSGNYIYNVTSVTIAGLVNGTDYIATAEMLKMGYVKLLPAADVDTAGEVIAVTITSPLVNGRRVFNPQTAGIARVEAWVYWTSDDYQTIMLRDHILATITPSSPEFKDADYSDLKFSMSVLSDLRVAGRPAGRFVAPILQGGVPNKTF